MNESPLYERFSDRARKVMQLANQEALRLCHEYIGTEHILLGIILEGSGVAANVLKNLDIDLRNIRREVEVIVQSGPDMVTLGKLPQTPRAKKVIEYSIEEARNLNHNYIGTEHLLLGLFREQEGIAAQVLMNLGLGYEKALEEIRNLLGPGDGTKRTEEEWVRNKEQLKTPALDCFGRDLTILARAGKLDPVIGRSSEIDEVLLVLSCHRRNRPLLVGEVLGDADAVVEGLAQRIVSGRVPYKLVHSRLVALDLNMLTHTERGQTAERLRAVLNEARRAKVLLFLPDVRSLLEATAAGLDAVFRTVLRSASLPLIAAVNLSELRTHIEPDVVVRDSFQTILVCPPQKADVVAILQALRDRLETHHRVQITDGALRAAVELADRYLSGPSLKDSAVQVLDRAGAMLRLRITGQPPGVEEMDAQCERLNREKESAIAEQDFEKAVHLRDQADKLKKRKEALLDEWRRGPGAPQGVVDEELVKEIVARMAPQPF
jgi:ATP-dependent Clp protease ATP-binding subunit ClpC